MIGRIFLLMLMFIFGLSAPALAAEPGKGAIQGRVVNGTADGSSVAFQDVILKTYLNDAEVGTATSKTDGEGHFVFGGLPTESGYTYQITLTFQQAEYNSERVGFNKGETTKPIRLTVYDSTTGDEAVKVAMSHTIIYVEQGTLLVKEYFLFVNKADRTYIGLLGNKGGRETLKFSLPRGATQVQYTTGLMECCIASSEGGFSYSMPVLPGASEVAYSYRVSYISGRYTFSRNTNYPTTRYDLLVQGGDIKVNSNQLTAQGVMNIRSSQFNHFSGGNFAPGSILMVQLSGLPQAGNQRAVLWVALMLVVLSAGFSFIYMRRGKLQPVSSQDSLDERRQRLFIELAELDDEFADGKFLEEVYRKKRAVKKAQLVGLMRRSQGRVPEDNGG